MRGCGGCLARGCGAGVGGQRFGVAGGVAALEAKAGEMKLLTTKGGSMGEGGMRALVALLSRSGVAGRLVKLELG